MAPPAPPADLEAGVVPDAKPPRRHRRHGRRHKKDKSHGVGADESLVELSSDVAAPFGVSPRELTRLTEV